MKVQERSRKPITSSESSSGSLSEEDSDNSLSSVEESSSGIEESSSDVEESSSDQDGEVDNGLEDGDDSGTDDRSNARQTGEGFDDISSSSSASADSRRVHLVEAYGCGKRQREASEQLKRARFIDLSAIDDEIEDNSEDDQRPLSLPKNESMAKMIKDYYLHLQNESVSIPTNQEVNEQLSLSLCPLPLSLSLSFHACRLRLINNEGCIAANNEGSIAAAAS